MTAPKPDGLRCQWTQRGGYPQCALLTGHIGAHAYDDWVTCPTCHGSGMVDDGLGGQEPCPTCGEDGYVDPEVASWFEAE